jgi:hypothetical protein
MAKEGVKEPKKFINSAGHIKDRIIIHQTPDIPKQGAFVSLNGFAFQIQPGKEVDIPRPVRIMIDNCIVTELVQENGEEYTRNRPRYPYTLVEADVNKATEANEA